METNIEVVATEYTPPLAPLRQAAEPTPAFLFAWGELARRLDAYGVWLSQREQEPKPAVQ